MRDFHTDLYARFIDGSEMCFPRVHPDNEYRIESGLLVFEDESGEKIHRLPIANILNFYTVCCEGCAY